MTEKTMVGQLVEGKRAVVVLVVVVAHKDT